jgi:hypothetical protein
MEAVVSSEMLVGIYYIIWRNILEDSNLEKFLFVGVHLLEL